MIMHSKNYTLSEENVRFNTFKANMVFIESENSKNHSFTLGLTPFADLTLDEFRVAHVGSVRKPNTGMVSNLGEFVLSNRSLPSAIDWSKKGATTGVKNQGQCGSCWDFAAIASIESRVKISTGKLQSLSEQQVLDCAGAGSCNGGWSANAINYAAQTSLCTEDSYPYAGKKNHQSHCGSCTVGLQFGMVQGYRSVSR